MSFNGTSIGDITINSPLDQSYTNASPYITIVNSNTGTALPGTGGSLWTDGSWSNDSLLTAGSWNTSLDVKGDAKIEGKLEVGGKDIGELLDKIEKRLAILHPNKDLEERWDKLRELGEQYRQLEKDLLDQENIYNILSK